MSDGEVWFVVALLGSLAAISWILSWIWVAWFIGTAGAALRVELERQASDGSDADQPDA